MVKNQAINCHSGKQIPCEIDSVCIHGDNESSLATAKSIKENLIENGLKLKSLNTMKKFILKEIQYFQLPKLLFHLKLQLLLLRPIHQAQHQ